MVPAERVDVPPRVAAAPGMGVWLEDPHQALDTPQNGERLRWPRRRTSSMGSARALAHARVPSTILRRPASVVAS